MLAKVRQAHTLTGVVHLSTFIRVQSAAYVAKLLRISIGAEAEEFDVITGADSRFVRGDFDLTRYCVDAFEVGKQEASA